MVLLLKRQCWLLWAQTFTKQNKKQKNPRPKFQSQSRSSERDGEVLLTCMFIKQVSDPGTISARGPCVGQGVSDNPLGCESVPSPLSPRMVLGLSGTLISRTRPQGLVVIPMEISRGSVATPGVSFLLQEAGAGWSSLSHTARPNVYASPCFGASRSGQDGGHVPCGA